MKKNRFIFAVLVSAATIIYSCSKSDKSATPEPPAPVSETLISSVSGKVLDDLGQPVSGATVVGGKTTTTTDVNGVFNLKDAVLYRTGGLVTVKKAGFLIGQKTFAVSASNLQFVSVKLIKEDLTTQTFSAANGGTITLPSGCKIIIEPGSLINSANDQLYTGTVTIQAQFIDPASGDFAETMPGSILGKSRSGGLAGVHSSGILHVELLGSNMEKLQLGKEQLATISLPIVFADYHAAPPSLMLSSLNDSTGLWQEDGVALKSLTEYSGKVRHFSFWNFHTGYRVFQMTAVIKTPGNVSIPHALGTLTYNIEGINSRVSSYGDTSGVIKLMIPQNATANFVVNSICGEQLHQGQAGPYWKDTVLNTIHTTKVCP